MKRRKLRKIPTDDLQLSVNTYIEYGGETIPCMAIGSCEGCPFQCKNADPMDVCPVLQRENGDKRVHTVFKRELQRRLRYA